MQYEKITLTKDKAKDIGMAIALAFTLMAIFQKNEIFLYISGLILAADMLYPNIFSPIARPWFTLTKAWGSIMSGILLTVVFFIIITPVGLVRKMLVKDPLKLNFRKKQTDTAFTVREWEYEAGDLEYPF